MERERYERYEGKVARVRFAGGSGDGYMIADVVDGRGRKETIVGVLHDAVVGTLIEAEIERVSHPKFGAQLKIVGSAKTSPPTDKNGLAIFLSGCPEITEAKARKLVDAIDRVRVVGCDSQRESARDRDRRRGKGSQTR